MIKLFAAVDGRLVIQRVDGPFVTEVPAITLPNRTLAESCNVLLFHDGGVEIERLRVV